MTGRTIRVTGKGCIQAKPDMTRVTIKLTDVHKEYESTLSASAGDSELLRSELAKLGFKKDELKTLF